MKIRQKLNKLIFLIIENWISDLGFKRCIICNFKIHYNGVCSRAHAISVFVLHVLSFFLLFHLLFLMKFKKFTSPSLYIYLYNILGWSSFPSICPIIRPFKFLILEEKDDGTRGRRQLMALVAVYPHVHVILLA